MLRQLEGTRGRSVEYKAVDSVYWTMCQQLLEELEQMGETRG